MIIPPATETLRVEKLGRIHLVGIGGAGLSGIARILLARGVPVSGSDAKDSSTLAELAELGATVWPSHDASHVETADTLVVSTAIKESNPEIVEARRRGLRLLSRASALAAVMHGRRVVAVSGAHGKTTTSSMLAVTLQACGADPSFALGGVLESLGVNAYDGTGDLFVVEADESDRAFLQYNPEVALVTNIDPDHLDMYGSAEAYHEAFEEFADTIRPGGFLVACADDEGARRLIGYARARGIDVRSYGEAPDADVRIGEVALEPLGSAYRPVVDGQLRAPIQVRVPGHHHVLNSAAAYTAGLGLGLADEDLRQGLSSFTGTRRRFEFKGEAGGVRVYDDYAHHPTELRVNLQAARKAAGDGRLVVAYRPLRHTRLSVFHREFGEILGMADEVVLADPTGDDPIDGVSGALVLPYLELPAERVCYEPDWARVPQRAYERVRPGDLLLTAGAPDAATIGPRVLALLASSGPSDHENRAGEGVGASDGGGAGSS